MSRIETFINGNFNSMGDKVYRTNDTKNITYQRKQVQINANIANSARPARDEFKINLDDFLLFWKPFKPLRFL